MTGKSRKSTRYFNFCPDYGLALFSGRLDRLVYYVRTARLLLGIIGQGLFASDRVIRVPLFCGRKRAGSFSGAQSAFFEIRADCAVKYTLCVEMNSAAVKFWNAGSYLEKL